MIHLDGPDFQVDDRLLSLWLVKYGLSEVAMFGKDGRGVHASEFLYRRSVMIVRGSFRPATLVNQDMLRSSYHQFRHAPDVDPTKTQLLTELTMENLGTDGDLDERDFLDRAVLLNAIGQTVVISSYTNHRSLVDYLAEFKVPHIGIVFGVRELLDLITEKYYQNQDGRLLAAFGELFTRNVKIYVYPALQEGSADVMTAENIPIPEGVKFLYRHLLDSGQIEDVTGYHPEHLHIFSREVLTTLRTGASGWEEMVPDKVADLIKEKCLFGYPSERLEFEY